MAFEINSYVYYRINPEHSSFSDTVVQSKVITHNLSSYAILNYDPNILCFDDTIHSMYRSVVLSHPEKKLLCFSPPKSIDYCSFTEKYPQITNTIVISEKIEGVMINLFFDHRAKLWQIATKSAIGGNYKYHSLSDNNPLCLSTLFFKHPQYDIVTRKIGKTQTTFLDMFFDALCIDRNKPLDSTSWIQDLYKEYSYSFVLQHPENNIGIPVKSPKLYLVAVYEISENRAIQIPSYVYESWPIFLNIHGIIDFPQKYESYDYETLEKRYCSNYTNYNGVGLVLWNYETGERSCLQNPRYKDNITIRKTIPNLHYQYLCLRRIDKVGDFLKYFPKYKKNIRFFEKYYDDFVKTLHQAYLDVYVHKKIRCGDVNSQFIVHIEYLHRDVYLKSIGTTRLTKITRDVVKKYVDNMEPRQLLYIFNQGRRFYN